MTWNFPERQNRIAFAPRVRERIFLREKGICHICQFKIKVGEKWEVEHKDALWAGGSALEANCLPAHIKCHKIKTAAEAPQRAKESRVRQKHIGAWKPKIRPMDGTIASPFKKKMDGTVVRR